MSMCHVCDDCQKKADAFGEEANKRIASLEAENARLREELNLAWEKNGRSLDAWLLAKGRAEKLEKHIQSAVDEAYAIDSEDIGTGLKWARVGESIERLGSALGRGEEK